MNLLTFYENGEFQSEDYMHATRLWTVTLEISVLMAQFPSKEIAQRSYDFRTLGLGYANIGGLLMNMGYGIRQRRRPRALWGFDSCHDRCCLRYFRGDGGRVGRVPWLQEKC